MLPKIQEWIHTMEEGAGAKVVLFLTTLLAFVALAVLYDMRCFKNFYATEAMDSAQLARNIAEGRGYVTKNIRPFSLHLLREHREDRDPQIKTDHPDLANPPVYPFVLAGLMKSAKMKYEIPRKAAFVTYQPERWIAGLNQFLFYCAVVLVFVLGSKLFDKKVAWVTALVFIGAEIFWKFSVSGLSTMLLIVIFLGLVWCLAALDEWQRDPASSMSKIIGVSALAGLLIGLAAMTRYSFLWLILPALLCAALFTPRCRGRVIGTLSLVFLAVVTPWIVRNFMVSGTPFGTAGYALYEQMLPFPEDTLQRALRPELLFDKLMINDFGRKLLVNVRLIMYNDLPKLGGSWVAGFFLCGLLLPYRNPTLSRLRIFLVASLVLFVLVQAWGRTNLSDLSPDVNSENLFAVFAPAIFIFGVAFFFVLLEQLELPFPGLHQAIAGLFVLVASMPLVFSLLPPQTHPYAYPPYFPPLIQQMAGWMKEKELVMSDVPAAVAWYGDRQAIALTLDYEKEFYNVNDDMKPVQGLYLTPVTLDRRFLTQLLRPTIRNQKTWERFVFESLSRGEVVAGFPLKKSRLDFLPDHLFLTDWERWKLRGPNQPALKPKMPGEEQEKPVTEILKPGTNAAPTPAIAAPKVDLPSEEPKKP